MRLRYLCSVAIGSGGAIYVESGARWAAAVVMFALWVRTMLAEYSRP